MNVVSGFCCRSDKCRPVIIPELLNLNLTRIMASSAILDYDQAMNILLRQLLSCQLHRPYSDGPSACPDVAIGHANLFGCTVAVW